MPEQTDKPIMQDLNEPESFITQAFVRMTPLDAGVTPNS